MNYIIDYLRKTRKRVTTATVMDASGLPRESWEAEEISNLPRQMRRHAEKLAAEAREELERKPSKTSSGEWIS
jgi:hypothetical protein